ncbi:GTPase-associated system all-helical protein GASH [Polyangium sp. 6x1]|uniref:GTPase-associated system all-helical protein GASH n=1 Tax=Polyangium sp. 6x1 TaxID=3042689 RepID=UPI0024821C28|nr:GTPase-associated system all-helical protein GASH [Polyangium sp. 6x1]MDI1444866.1 GTPase-associated system all-helical protein GASH [Polyangium sp. 6x1]
MADLLTELLAAGLIEKLGGDDERFAKIERAANAVGQELITNRPELIRAILAGLDPDVPANDPAITKAHRALVAEWKSMGTVYDNPPVGLYRAILLGACSHAAEGTNAAIIWLTAADTLPLLRIGREEHVVRGMLERIAARGEEAALDVPSIPTDSKNGKALLQVEAPGALKAPAARKVDRQDLLQRVAATAGPHHRDNKPIPGANQIWTNSAGSWSYEFSERMHVLLADELDSLAREVAKYQTDVAQRLQASQAELIKKIDNSLTAHHDWVREALSASEHRQQADQVRLNALWWSEALYSQSLRCGYRELPTQLAAVVMAIDLLDLITKPAPASVSYLLAETVCRLSNADFERQHQLPALLTALREARRRLPQGWAGRFIPPPKEGRLSLRDLVIVALGDQEWSLDGVVQQAGLAGESTLSLPVLARALFRQEQAVQLAMEKR